MIAPPQLDVQLAGRALGADRSRALQTLCVRQRLSAPAQAELVFSGRIDRDIPQPGQALQITIGGAAQPLFSGEVTAVEASYGGPTGPRLRVRGYDRLHRLRNRRAARGFSEITLLELATQLVENLGMRVSAEQTGPRLRLVVQHGQSDLALLLELAERAGLYLFAQRDELRVLTLEGKGPPVPLVLGENLLEATLEANASGACRRVAIAGWDPRDNRRLAASATQARSGRRISFEVHPNEVGADEERALFDRLASEESELQAQAQAELDLRRARDVSLRGLALGDAALAPGAQVQLRGVANAFEGIYVVSEVTHSLDAERGFLSELGTQPPPPLPKPIENHLSLGQVSRVDDPARQARVCVRLPALGDVETDWMQVLSLGAGASKGLIVLPAVDDDVLVLLPCGDPARGFVLGGLYGAQRPHDPGVDRDAVQRFTLRTSTGQTLRFDDAEGHVRVEGAGGSYLELGKDGVHLRSSGKLTLEAPGRAITVLGDSVDFERG